jgi:hypothetical protein
MGWTRPRECQAGRRPASGPHGEGDRVKGNPRGSSLPGPVPRRYQALFGTAVDALKPFINGLVVSRSSPACLDTHAAHATATSLYVGE